MSSLTKTAEKAKLAISVEIVLNAWGKLRGTTFDLRGPGISTFKEGRSISPLIYIRFVLPFVN